MSYPKGFPYAKRYPLGIGQGLASRRKRPCGGSPRRFTAQGNVHRDVHHLRNVREKHKLIAKEVMKC